MSRRFDCDDPDERRRGHRRRPRSAARRGELVVLPTDTVYGIGCDAFSPRRRSPRCSRPRAAAATCRCRSWSARPRTLDGLVVGAAAGGARPGRGVLAGRADPGRAGRRRRCAGTSATPTARSRVRMPLHPVALELLRAVGPMAVSRPTARASRRPSTVDEAAGAARRRGVGLPRRRAVRRRRAVDDRRPHRRRRRGCCAPARSPSTTICATVGPDLRRGRRERARRARRSASCTSAPATSAARRWPSGSCAPSWRRGSAPAADGRRAQRRHLRRPRRRADERRRPRRVLAERGVDADGFTATWLTRAAGRARRPGPHRDREHRAQVVGLRPGRGAPHLHAARAGPAGRRVPPTAAGRRRRGRRLRALARGWRDGCAALHPAPTRRATTSTTRYGAPIERLPRARGARSPMPCERHRSPPASGRRRLRWPALARPVAAADRPQEIR